MSDTSRRWPDWIDFEGRVARVPFALVAFGFAVAIPWMIDVAIWCARDLGVALPFGKGPAVTHQLPVVVTLPVLFLDGVAIIASAAIVFSFEIRRLHDMNLTGWLVLARLVFFALPFPDMHPFPSIASLIWSALLALVPGTTGPNAYGTDRRQQASDASVRP